MKLPSTFRFHLREVAIRFIIAYPICFYLYGSVGVALVCMSHFIDECIPMALFSPMFMIMGPIAHDDEDPPNVFLRVLLVAIVAVALWTVATTIVRARQSR